MSALKFHPLAAIFPLMEGAEFDALVADIRANGLREPVVVFEDMILDGRNRYRACRSLGYEPTFTVYPGDDPVSYVVSLNLRRRHLDESQRAMVAVKLEIMRQGERTDLQPSANLHKVARADAAALLSVSERTVASAAKVLNHGTPELVQAVERGDVSVSAASQVATLPEPEQRETLAGGDKAVKAKAKEILAERRKRSAAAKKGAEKAAETRRRKREEKQEAMIRELEGNEREMKELASRLIALDRAVAHAVYEAAGNWHRRDLFRDALEEGLGLIDEPDDTSDDDNMTVGSRA